jgi:hypothetical protein
MSRNWLWGGFAVACTLAGFIGGWYVGVDSGATALGSINAQNDVSRAMGNLQQSLKLLARNDLAAYGRASDIRIQSALLDIGTRRSIVDGFWSCSPRDHQTMDDVRRYLVLHPLDPADPLVAFERKGAAFCGAR